jgi:transitional endoplasmic reticulum ATPase
MQGFEKNQNQTLLVIAATNCPWNIDSAFLRPGRFDEKIYIPLPDKIARKEIVSKELWDIQAQIDINEIVKITEGFNSSDIVEFIERLKLHAIKRSIATRAVEPISQTDLLLVSKSCKSSVNKNDLIAMDEYNKQNNKNY